MINEYVDVLIEKLPRYKVVKVPTVSELEMKYILADLISRGLKVRYENGFFIFEGYRDD